MMLSSNAMDAVQIGSAMGASMVIAAPVGRRFLRRSQLPMGRRLLVTGVISGSLSALVSAIAVVIVAFGFGRI